MKKLIMKNNLTLMFEALHFCNVISENNFLLL